MTDLATISRPAAERNAAAEDEPKKRRLILDAAARLFMAQGYGATSMELVARTANVSKATLYAYFDSKDALFASIVADRSKEMLFDDAIFGGEVTDLPAALTRIGQTFLRFMLHADRLAIYRVAVAECARFPELGRAFFENGPQRSQAGFIAWIERRQKSGLVATATPRIAAYQFMALLRGCVFMRASMAIEPAPNDAEIDETVAAAVETWMAAFGVRRPVC